MSLQSFILLYIYRLAKNVSAALRTRTTEGVLGERPQAANSAWLSAPRENQRRCIVPRVCPVGKYAAQVGYWTGGWLVCHHSWCVSGQHWGSNHRHMGTASQADGHHNVDKVESRWSDI